MKPLLAVAATLAMAVAGAGLSMPFLLDAQVPSATPAELGHVHPAGADEAVVHAGHAGDAPPAHDPHEAKAGAPEHLEHAQSGMVRPRFPPAEGKTPTSGEGLHRVANLVAGSDKDLRSIAPLGNGTLEDPFVIEGLHVTGTLELADTDACVTVRGNYIAGQLALNWNGPCVHVHHNHIRDLRVNENVARTGYATGGLLESNKIGVVGQLRHYDGEFRNNVVGPRAPRDLFDAVLETTPLLADDLVANVDGFNQGLIHHNTFHGPVDLDFHGHHHGTGFYSPHSHYHGDDEERMALHVHDHTDRWTSVEFTDNRVVDQLYGLRYEDRNHAGDDRTANSESTEVLDEPHVHHTSIRIAGNSVEGGRIWVDVLNAGDTLHRTRNPATLVVEGNTIVTHETDEGRYCVLSTGPWFDAWSGITIWAAQEADMRIVGNHLAFVPAQRDLAGTLVEAARECLMARPDPAAISLDGVRDSTILVQGNDGAGWKVGVEARGFDAATKWTLQDNRFPGKAYTTDTDNEPTVKP